MTACLENCKWMCISVYVIAAIGALICAYNHLRTEGKAIELPKKAYYILAIGALGTLWCAGRWALRAEGKGYQPVINYDY